MRHPDNVEIGVATHTGRVRHVNEDDFLLCAPQNAEELARMGWIAAIADGMGGAVGGAEASRTAVRAAVRPFLDTPVTNGTSTPAARMREGFAAAVSEVFELSQENLNLRGMGTTLTIVNLLGRKMVLGHVGDTRCLRIRDGRCEQLSEDHAVREPDNYLTRCIGAGQREVEADVAEFDVRADDRFVLMTDGVWAVVSVDDIQEIVGVMPPQEAATELVRLANRNGGPDNSTLIIMHVRSIERGAHDGDLVEVDLPAEEVLQPSTMLPAGRELIPSRWPWVLLVLAFVLLAVGVAKVAFGIDVIEWAVSRFR